MAEAGVNAQEEARSAITPFLLDELIIERGPAEPGWKHILQYTG
jgi:hypothetical protein